MEKEEIEKNYELYVTWLKKNVGETEVANLFTHLEGNTDECNNLKYAVFGNTVDSGVAYDGSLIKTVFEISSYAKKINKILPEEIQVSEHSITKVAFLSHVAKALMFTENDNSWEKTNRGILYKFTDLDGALRCGERSIMLCMNSGIRFSEVEYEAMRIMDKANDNTDNYTKCFSSTLSMVIRQANEIIMQKNKVKK